MSAFEMRSFEDLPSHLRLSDEGRLMGALLAFNNSYPDVVTNLSVLFHFIDSQKTDEEVQAAWFKGYAESFPRLFDQPVMALVNNRQYQQALDALGEVNVTGNLALRQAMSHLRMLRDTKATMELPGLEHLSRHRVKFSTLNTARLCAMGGASVEEKKISLPGLFEPLAYGLEKLPGGIEHGKTAAILLSADATMKDINAWVQQIPDATLETVFTISAKKNAPLTDNKAAPTPLEVKQGVNALASSPVLNELVRHLQRISSRLRK